MPSSSDITIILPFIREKGALRVISALSGDPEAKDAHIQTEEDSKRIGCPAMVKRLIDRAETDLVCFLGDDTIPQPGMLSRALEAMNCFDGGWGLVGLNDGLGRRLPTHWLGHKRLLPLIGGEFFHTGYRHCFCDNELMERAEAAERYIFCEQAHLIHRHPILDKEIDWDEDYRRAYSSFETDKALFETRRANGWETPAKDTAPIVGIGIPLSWPYVPSDFFDCFTLMEKPEAHVIRASSGPIHEMRNIIVRRALDLGCTHLIFLDADMCYPENTIPRLLAHKKPIVGALCFKRWPPFSPTLFKGDRFRLELFEPYPQGLIEVTATGTGCLLIETDVFRQMYSPWFEFSETPEGGPVGEDVNFCYKAGDLGIPVFVDTTLKTEHLCQMRVNENMWKLNKSLIETKQGQFNF